MATRSPSDSKRRGIFPAPAPVLAVVETSEHGSPRRQVLRGWCAGEPDLRETDLAVLATERARPTLSPDGRSLLFTRVHQPVQDVTRGGVYRLDLASGRVDDTGFRLRPSAETPTVAYGSSPDGSIALICEEWRDPAVGAGPDDPGNRLTLTRVQRDGTPPRAVMTIPGTGFWQHSDSVAVQFSPDGGLVALSLFDARCQLDTRPGIPPGAVSWSLIPRVAVVNTQTWETQHTYGDACLAGPAAWGPASDRILLAPRRGTVVQHLGGPASTIDTLPRESQEDDQPRLLGMLDEQHLLYLDVRRGWAWIDSLRIRDGERRALRRWRAPFVPAITVAVPDPELWG